MPHQCWVSGSLLQCTSQRNLDDDLRHRDVSVCTDIFEEFFCLRRNAELRSGGHRDIPVVLLVYLFIQMEIYRYIYDYCVCDVGVLFRYNNLLYTQ